MCDYCHERLANLVNTQSEKQPITTSQITELSSIVENFSELTKNICGKQSASLKAAFKCQAGNYVHKFHSQRKNKLVLLLESESWKSTQVAPEFQNLVDKLASGTLTSGETVKSKTAANSLKIGAQDYITVSVVLMLIRLVTEYCICASDLPLMAPVIGKNLSELLRTFNSRSCQLVLGAGALRTAGLKTITSTSLALTSRALQLVLWMIPHVRAHFRSLCNDPLESLDTVERDVSHHIQQLEVKILSIMDTLLGEQLNEWDAKPPVPSKVFRNVSKQLVKLHEAVSLILPEEQVRKFSLLSGSMIYSRVTHYITTNCNTKHNLT